MIRTTDTCFPTGKEKVFLNCIWRVSEYDLHKRTEVILPKGTVEIIFNFSDKTNYACPSLQNPIKLPSVFINGINFKPFELYKSGQHEFVGIQLNAAGLKMLFNVPVKELNNMVCEGKCICPDLEFLAEKLYGEGTFSQQVEIIMNWIRRKMSLFHYGYSIERVQLLQQLVRSHKQSVKRLCEEVCLSDRQLRRFCLEWLGMNTEEYLLYSKYLHCLNHIHHSNQPLTDIGLEAGYFDQSHFIREFRSFTGMTPMQYRKANTELPGHIFL